MDDHELKRLVSVLQNGRYVEKMVACKALKKLSEQQPEKLVPYYPDLLRIISDKNVKVVWATLFLLVPMAVHQPEMAFDNLGLFANIAEGDSVIARDQYVKILVQLASAEAYRDTCLTLLIDEVLKAPVNQLPSYAQSAASVVDSAHRSSLKEVIDLRSADVEEYPPKIKKLQAVLKRLHKL